MKRFSWKNAPKPIIALAPMDGYTDSAFRRTCKSVNKNLVLFTEFTSADGLHHGAARLHNKLAYHKSEHPIIAQIFGKNAETFITAARYCESRGFDGIDINMGCPSKKVVKSEHGVALRNKPERAFKLVRAVAQATELPVSVKTRLGWDSADDLVEFARGIEKAGASLITVHGRTYAQGFGDRATFEPLYELKKAIGIPVLANGDIDSIADGAAKVKNLDGFMIGRASVGNPWAFADRQPAAFRDKVPLILKHAKFLIKLKGEKIALLEIRKHLVAYVKALPNASAYRSKLVAVASLSQICAILKKISNTKNYD
ncbi:MAG: tRNA-dihydrouridine synthase family protein [Patescibacteria group bacterium]